MRRFRVSKQTKMALIAHVLPGDCRCRNSASLPPCSASMATQSSGAARGAKAGGYVVQHQNPIWTTRRRRKARARLLLQQTDRACSARARVVPVAGQLLAREFAQI